jgi:beta-phosphoglucomutase-like phosphatase (HAD superfamily)
MDKLVIFDCDGVLVDSEIISNRIDAEALTSLGYEISTEESIRRFTGLNAKTVRQIILDESGKDVPLDYLNSQQPKVLKAFEAELCALIKPTLETLEEMKIYHRAHSDRCQAYKSAS